MHVVLLDNIRGVGRIGDVKDVKDGYARNFLFPRKLAKLATKSTKEEMTALRAKREILLEQEHQRAGEAAEKIKELVVKLTAKANDTGTLFAAIGKRELVSAIRDASGVQILEDMISYDNPIKTIGEHEIEILLAPKISVTITVNVSVKKEE